MSADLSSRSQVLITPDDQSPVVGIYSLIAILFAGVALAGRVFTKLAVLHRVTLDDYAILAGYVLGAAQSVLMVIAAQNGLGRREPPITASQRNLLDKSSYAADILYVAAIALVKISVAQFIVNVAPIDKHERISLIYITIISLWAFSSVLSSALVCKPDSTALLGAESCFGSSLAFWNAFDVINIITDIFLILWPIYLFRGVKIQLKKRIIVLAWFTTRICTVAAEVAQLVYLNKLSSSSDRTFDGWQLAMCTQSVLSLSIITACMPAIRPFLESVNSGLMRADNVYRHDTAGSYFSCTSLTASHKASVPDPSLLSRTDRQDGEPISLDASFKTTDWSERRASITWNQTSRMNGHARETARHHRGDSMEVSPAP